MGVTVVIPNYNGEKYIRGCLDTLLNQSLKAEEIIIVDNNSKDRSLEIIKSEYLNYVTLITQEENKGFSSAVNVGIKKSKSEFTVLLNNDTELDKDYLKNLYNFIKEKYDAFAVSSKMLRYDDRELIDDAGDEYTILGWGKKRGDGKKSSLYNNDEEVFSACAGAAIYRTKIFSEIGYFDEDFFAYLEDMDISYRARIYGYKNYFCSRAIVYHIGSATSGSRHNDFKVKLTVRNNIFLIYKNMPLLQIIINSPFLLLGILVKYIFFIRKGLGKSYFEGLKNAFKEIKHIEKIKVKNNFRVYFNIEKLLLINTINLLK